MTYPVFTFLQRLFLLSRQFTLIAIVSCGLGGTAFGQSSVTGVVSGRVFSPATGEYIRNAEVRIQGTQQFALTEDGGFYRLDNAPAGEVTVVVSYTGYDTATAKLTVTAGATATRDFELAGSPGKASKQGEIVKLDSFVVATEREGNAKAIMEQKGAMNVKTVISADSFGDIAEGNVGEFLKFMPGIVLDYVETDTRAARMGGLEARYGAVTLDGGGMANTSTGTFGDNSRQFEFEAISINNIESIEVNKTLSADMSGDAPAGTVNLRSRSALDRKGQRFNYSVGFIGNQYEHSLTRTPRHDDARHAKTRPTGSFDYSNSFFGKLGVSVNGSFTNVFKEQFRHALTYDYTSAQAIAAGSPLITAINFKDGPKMTEKSSGGLKVDYEPFKGLRLTLASSYTYFADEIANRNLNFRVSAAQLGAGSNLTKVIANPVAGNGTRIEQTGGHGDKKTDTSNLSLGFNYRLRSFTFDGQASYSRARQQNGTDHLGSFGTADLQLTRISYIAERPSVDSPSWSFTQTGGGDWFNLANYGRNDAQTGNISSSRSRSKTQQWVNQVNVRYVTPWREFPTYLRTGLFSKLTVRDREQLTAYTGSWVGPTPTGAIASVMPASIADFRIAPAWGGNIYGLPVPDKSALLALFNSNPAYFTQTAAQQATNLDTILGSNQDVEETVNATYALANTRVGRWQFQGGLRYEKTVTENKVIERVPDAKNPFPANTVQRILYRYSPGRTTNEGEYDAWLPSASATYRFNSDLIAKLGYHRALQRPNLNQLAGQWAIDEANQEVQIPNPNLTPTFSNKFSANVDYYFEPAGTLGVHVFQTDLKGDTQETSPAPASEFGYGSDPIFGTYEFTTFVNIPGTRTVRGIELNYRQQLAFLRNEMLRRTIVFASFSQFTTTQRPGGFVPRVATGGVTFRFGKFNANIQGTWTDNIRTGGNTVSAASRYFASDIEYLKERYVVDVGFGYKVAKRMDLFVSGRNAFNSGKTWLYKNTDGRIRQMERYGGQWTLGVRGSY